MARGKRTSLAALGDSVGVDSPVESNEQVLTVSLAHLAGNPANPRWADADDDLADLASIVDAQLQPALAVTRLDWIGLYPDRSDEVPETARYVVVAGNRRLRAARKYGCSTLDLVLRPALAASRATLVTAAINENLGRKNLDAIEEAEAIELLIGEYGTAANVAAALGRSQGWVSQRRALQRLSVPLRKLLRSGELPIEDARELARLPEGDQVNAWESRRSAPTPTEVPTVSEEHAADVSNGGSTPATAPSPSLPTPGRNPERIARTIKRWSLPPQQIAQILREIYSVDEFDQLVQALKHD